MTADRLRRIGQNTMQDNLTLIFSAAILSDLGEGPLNKYPDSFIRITRLPSFRDEPYTVRVRTDGCAVFKYGTSEYDAPTPDRAILLAKSDHSLESLNQFFYAVPDLAHVISATVPLDPTMLAQIRDSHRRVVADFPLAPPKVLQLDGSSVFIELAEPGKFLTLSVGFDYEPPFSVFLDWADQLADAAALAIPAVFQNDRSILATLDPETLHGLLENELPSVVALIFAFAPGDNMRDYLAQFRPGQADAILDAAKRINRRDPHFGGLFTEVERVLQRKLENK